DAKWEHWLDQASEWTLFFKRLENLQEKDFRVALQSFDLITDEASQLFSRLRVSAEGRAVHLPGPFIATDQDIAILALGFARSEPGSLAVPYAKKGVTC